LHGAYYVQWWPFWPAARASKVKDGHHCRQPVVKLAPESYIKITGTRGASQVPILSKHEAKRSILEKS